jgi:N-acetylmuramoyl-L-alanine amidase
MTAGAPSSRATFGLGDRGAAVAEIRDRLQRLGLLEPAPQPGPDQEPAGAPAPDPAGVVGAAPQVQFDAAMERAVREFQQDRGLTVDGIVGPLTFRRLEEARWALGDRVLSYRAGHLSSGDDVVELQSRLSRFGFDLGRVDGIFGPRTDLALREFQRSVGISPDGTCGPDTLRALTRLSRTMGGVGSQTGLRELTALAALATGVADKVVVLDHGHSSDPPRHPPAVPGLIEAAVVDDLIRRVEGRLAAIGVQVVLTRPPGSGAVPDERARAEFANAVDADLVLSLHVDSIESRAANGIAAYYYGDLRVGTASSLGARAAGFVLEELTGRTDLVDCRSHTKTWDLLRLTRMPTVLLECGYLSSPHDAARLADPAFRDALAEALAGAVVRFFAPDPP